MTRIVMVAAIDEGRMLGKNNQLLWRLPADLRHFRETTRGHPVIMGSRTWHSLGKALPQRMNIVFTRQRGANFHGACAVHSIEQTLALTTSCDTLYVIGGGELYALWMPQATHMLITRLHHRFDGDVTFPAWDADAWSVCAATSGETNCANPYAYTFYTYERISWKSCAH